MYIHNGDEKYEKSSFLPGFSFQTFLWLLCLLDLSLQIESDLIPPWLNTAAQRFFGRKNVIILILFSFSFVRTASISFIHLSFHSHPSIYPPSQLFFYIENLNCHFYLMKDVISFLATLLWNTCLTLAISVVLCFRSKDIKNVG